MHGLATIAALAAALQPALAAYQGFNYGSTHTDGSAKTESDFESAFKTAASLAGTNNAFTSARLYTMIQGGTASDVISAIPAAISTKTTLLLGLWASAGDDIFANELTALKTAISQYGSSLGPLVAGISVGSEDLYRNTDVGAKSNAGPGKNPDTLVKYIKEVRAAISGTPLADAPIGHVDTWTAWVNGTNTPVIDNVDFLGVDAYPYFQSTMPNDVTKGAQLLQDALDNTAGSAGGKPVWITETGWPVSGDKSGDAIASTKNAKTYWDDVGCPRFGSSNVWWYTLQDADPTAPNPSFGVISGGSTTPLFDLTCKASSSSSSSSSATSTKSSSSKTGTSTSARATATGGGSGSDSKSSSSSSSSSAVVPASSGAVSSTAAGNGSATTTTSAKSSTTAAAGNGTTVTKVTSTAAATGTGSGSSGSGATTTGSTGASSSPTTVVTSGAGMLSGSMGLLAAVVVGFMAL